MYSLIYMDNFLKTVINLNSLYDFYLLNLWKILPDALGWSSPTARYEA